MFVSGAGLLGAAFGSKLLAMLENPWQASLEGKTIVGGLLGGLIAVEAAKKYIGFTRSTGDLFTLPLIIGTAIGRVGCYLSGLADGTHGSPTSLPWGHDYGDGIPRHPAQLYEIAFLLLLGAFLLRVREYLREEGDEFKLYLSSYLAFRFFADFLKPGLPFFGLTAIQWACAGGLLYYRKWILSYVR